MDNIKSIKIKDLVEEGIKLSMTGNEYLKSQDLTFEEVSEFSKEMISCFGDAGIYKTLWWWETQMWEDFVAKGSNIEKLNYNIYIRRNTCKTDTIVCNFLNLSNPADVVIPFKLIFSNSIVKDNECLHKNKRQVFIGPMVGNVDYCPDCKQEV